MFEMKVEVYVYIHTYILWYRRTDAQTHTYTHLKKGWDAERLRARPNVFVAACIGEEGAAASGLAQTSALTTSCGSMAICICLYVCFMCICVDVCMCLFNYFSEYLKCTQNSKQTKDLTHSPSDKASKPEKHFWILGLAKWLVIGSTVSTVLCTSLLPKNRWSVWIILHVAL